MGVQANFSENEASRQVLARIHVLSRATFALLALLSFLPASLGFRELREDSGEESFNFRYVSTPNDLVAAVTDGVRHVVITKHLDLTDLSNPLSTLTGGVIETTSTVTIQVRFSILFDTMAAVLQSDA